MNDAGLLQRHALVGARDRARERDANLGAARRGGAVGGHLLARERAGRARDEHAQSDCGEGARFSVQLLHG
jgi:hypothetical protein